MNVSFLPKLIYKLNDILIKIPASFFGEEGRVEIGKLILKHICKAKDPRLAKIILRKWNDVHHLIRELNAKLQKSGSCSEFHDCHPCDHQVPAMP